MISNNNNIIDELKLKLDSEFKIKDLGNLKYFLGIKEVRSRDGMHKCQRKYAWDLLKDASVLGSKISSLPLDQITKLLKDEGDPT